MLRSYELMVILRSTLDQKAAGEEVEKISELIESHQGSIIAIDTWGRRKLAYPIENLAEGIYVLFKVMMIPSTLNDIEFTLKLDEAILRYMIVKMHKSVAYEASTLTDDVAESDEFDTDEANYEESYSEEPVLEETDSAEADTEASEEEDEEDAKPPVAEAVVE